MTNPTISPRGQVLLALSVAVLSTCLPAAAEDEPVRNARYPAEGILFGGQPSEAEMTQLIDKGYKTVIDLRMPSEDRGFDQAALLSSLGVAYQPLPVNGTALEVPRTYERFFELLVDAERPVLVHCASGNRVGALWYAWLAGHEGVSRDEALAEARKQGLRSDQLVKAVDGWLQSREP